MYHVLTGFLFLPLDCPGSSQPRADRGGPRASLKYPSSLSYDTEVFNRGFGKATDPSRNHFSGTDRSGKRGRGSVCSGQGYTHGAPVNEAAVSQEMPGRRMPPG